MRQQLTEQRREDIGDKGVALTPRWFATAPRLLFWLAAYFAVQVLVRLIISPNAELDESEQLLFTQSYQWGYGAQPPLYTWLQKVIFAVTGPGIFGLALFKNALLFGTYALSYAAARLLTRNHAASVIAAVSLIFLPQIAWESQRDLTHSVLVTMMSAATVVVFLKLEQNRQWPWYLALGAVIGLGILSKYTYLLMPVGLCLAALCIKEYRRAVLSPWMLAALLVAVLIVLPHALWFQQHWLEIRANNPELTTPAARSAAAMGKLVVKMLGAPLAQVLAIAAAFALLCWRQWRPWPAQRWREPRTRFLLLTIVLALLSVFAVMLVTRHTTFKSRWLQSVYWCVPLLIATLLHQRFTRAAVVRVLALAGLVALVVSILLPTRVLLAGLDDARELQAPMRQMVRQMPFLSEVDLIMADGRYLGGNLRIHFPQKRIITPGFGQCPAAVVRFVAVFDATRREKPPAAWLRLVERCAGSTNVLAQLQLVNAPGPRKMRIGFIRGTLGPSAPANSRLSSDESRVAN